MNKTVLMTATIASLAVNVFAADNNFIGGTDNTISVNSKSSMVTGFQNHIDANNAFAFGTDNTVTGENGFAGGNNATAAGRNSFAFGSHAESLVEYTIAMGNQARTSAYNTIAIGNGAYANGESTVVIGRTNTVNAENATVIGSNNGTVASGQGVVVGYNNKAQGSNKEMLAFGSNNTVQNQGATVLGSHGQAVAVDSLALGNNTVADVQNQVDMAQINQTNARLNKLGASSAALAGLHPLDFNRNDKVSYAISYGYYRNSNAIALGVFARPNERIMLGFGATLGAENQYNLSLSFKTGKGSDYIQEAKDKDSRISKLETLVQQLIKEVELSKQSK